MEELGYDLPKEPIAGIERAPVTILNLNRNLSLSLKSLSPHQPPGWNDPYRILKF
jgi:hypothetical protein